MPVRRTREGRWRYREMVRLPDGTTERISGSTPRHNNTKAAAQEALREHVDRLLGRKPQRKEVPTYEDWFNGRFWTEWVIGERNKPSEQEAKRSIFKHHLGPAFGALPLDAIGVGEVQQLRARLVEQKLSDKRINNIMAVLSKTLRYAADVELIEKVPRMRLLRIERPEMECWSFEDYARLLAAAKEEGPEWYVAVCLAGEAGLRIGEIRALRWRMDADLIGRTVTINQQSRHGVAGTPKGRTRRTVPMTSTLEAALRSLSVVRDGFVVRNADGSAVRDPQGSHAIYRICRRAGLPESGWHVLRHTFGSHAARFGVNPWMLMDWMGHKRIDETMGYVHLADRRPRPIPAELLAVGQGIVDPQARVLAMLGARGKTVAKDSGRKTDSLVTTAA